MQVAIIGFGPVGREAAKLLTARGDIVRIVQRKTPAVLPPGAEFAAADVLDLESLRRACLGCAAVICCLGFPYDSRIWARAWPRAMDNMLAVCRLSGARFIFADNLYMYGPQDRPLVEGAPLTTFGRKPEIRTQLTRAWHKAHRTCDVEAVAVRASDFYGPDVSNSVLSEFGVKRLLQGMPALFPYSPDYPHDFTYVPDFARALVTLLDAPIECYGQAWHVPNAPTKSLRQLIALAAAQLDVAPRVKVLPGLATRLLGLFNRPLYELAEMKYQTDRPYYVDSSKYIRQFGGEATPFEDGLRETIAFYCEALKA